MTDRRAGQCPSTSWRGSFTYIFHLAPFIPIYQFATDLRPEEFTHFPIKVAHNNILIIDGEESTRSTLWEALGVAGYRTVCAADTDDAKHLIQQQPPDLIICTTSPATRTDLDALRFIRENPATAVVPIIVIAERFDPHVMRQAMDLGADDFLVKPLGPTQIVASVDARLHRMETVQETAALAQRRLIDMVNDTPVLIAMCDLTTSRFEFINRPGRTMINLSATAAANDLRFPDLFKDLALDHVLEQVATKGNWHGDASMQPRDGKTVPVSLWITAHSNDQKPVEYISVIAADITNRRKAEEALRQNAALLRGITDHATEAISVIDADDKVVWHNPAYCHTLGIVDAKPAGQNAFDRIHPEDRCLVQEALTQARRTGASETFSFRVPGDDDTTRFFEAIATRTTLDDSKHTRLIQIARDITERINDERERAIEHLAQTHAQKLESIGQLAAGVAHEINTPIQFVGDNLRFLRDAFSDISSLIPLLNELTAASTANDAVASIATRINSAIEKIDLPFLEEEIPAALNQSIEGVQRVAKLVQAMKAFSHPGPVEMAPADLNTAIRNTVEVSRNEWKYVAEVDLQLDPHLGLVPCVVGEINQVVLNLVVNAAHAIKDRLGDDSTVKGNITISTKQLADHFEMSVRDTGSGMKNSVREKLFEPFFTTKPIGKGTGQGLAIARAVVVEKHHGTIDVESTWGEGSCFTIRLPLESELRKSA